MHEQSRTWKITREARRRTCTACRSKRSERDAREIKGGAPLYREGSYLAARDTLEQRLETDRADADAEPKLGCGADPARMGRKKKSAAGFGKTAAGRRRFHCAAYGSGVAPRNPALGIA